VNVIKILLMFVVPFTLFAQGPDMPEGEGRDVIRRVCTKCHDAYHYATVFATRQTWEKTIDTMVQRGANLSDPEVKKNVIEYFVKYFGVTANLNDDTAKELETKLGITPEEAEAIVKYRTDNGDFRSYRDVGRVPGLDTSKLDPLKQRLRY
jgi:competence protein ComEA